MNQTEQVTSVTGTDIDAAIRDERMTELERQINNLYAEAARQGKRIERLEAALETWLIAVNYDDAATPPMNEMAG